VGHGGGKQLKRFVFHRMLPALGSLPNLFVKLAGMLSVTFWLGIESP